MNVRDYILKEVILQIDEKKKIMWNLPNTKKETFIWKNAIHQIKYSLQYNMCKYKAFTRGMEKLTKYEKSFLKYNIHYAGLNFLPEQIIKIIDILNNLKLLLAERKNFLPFQSKSRFYLQDNHIATKNAHILASRSQDLIKYIK
jgi:hypothetical protein|tara:strand:+ start:194 stop:625 length:432 start_codon:yes stop_codon:yes gene_type:complete